MISSSGVNCQTQCTIRIHSTLLQVGHRLKPCGGISYKLKFYVLSLLRMRRLEKILPKLKKVLKYFHENHPRYLRVPDATI